MPRFAKRVPPFKAPRSFSFDWQNFRGGLNTLFRDQEIKDNELSQATNLMLVAQGVPTKRWGTAIYYLAGESGMVRGLKGFYPSGASGSNELLAITDDGLLTVKSNASYTVRTGASWASGYPVEMAQLDNRMYIVNGQRELARYSNPTLVGFPTIAQPSALFATQISGVSGTNTYSYMLTHTSTVGETSGYLATGVGNIYVLPNQPTDPSLGSTKIQWTNASTASGVRTGTNIYGRTLGYETFLAHVDGTATQWIDDGNSVPQLFSFGPKSDSTGGPICGVVRKFQDRLVYSKFLNDSTLVMISGRVPNQERFDFGSGGGFVRIEPDSGDDITAIETTEDKIIVFKERSVWSITINQVQIGNFFLIEPVYKLITGSVGCSSQKSVVRVENDIVFLGRGGRGLYVLGREPNFVGDVLRTNEISIKDRPYFQDLTPAQELSAAAAYFNYKYIITFPGKNECMVFDRERNAMMGPWTIDGSNLEVYSDSSDIIRLVMGDDDSTNVDEFSSSYPGDRGSAFTTILRTKKDDMGDWTRFKNIQNVFTRWRNILGSVDVTIRTESRTGTTVTSSDFTVTPTTGSSGWGDNLWGNTMWGDSTTAGTSADQSETVRQALLNDTARNIQITVQTDELNDNYELLGIKTEAQDIGDYRPSAWRV